MSSLRLYFDLMSQPSRAVFIFLKANNINFEQKKIDLKKGEHMTEEYRAVSRFGLVPVIDDNGFQLTESVGIMRYLCREKGVADHWYPKDSKKQAQVDEYLEWQHLNTRANCALFFRIKFLHPMVTGKLPSDKEVAKRQKLMEETLNKLENDWLGDRKFLVGNEITIADILGACEVEQPRMAGFDPCEGRPRLSAWMERVKQQLAPHYEDAHKVVRLVTDKFGGNVPESRMAGFDPCEGRPRLSAWMERVKQQLAPHYEDAHKVVRLVTDKFGGNVPESRAKLHVLQFLWPTITGKAPNEKDVAKRQKLMEETLNKIENDWLRDNKFLVGNEITIADILGACEVEQPRMAGFDPCEGRPRLSAWMERVKQQLAPHYEDAHEKVRSITNKFGGKVPESMSKL
ncbi:hypothetical protein B566_EDAN005935 [Ephemera danica]|nr:hypothetical protein B566_EDAN005935 [Ephemera danica]